MPSSAVRKILSPGPRMCFKVVWEIEPDARAIEKAALPAPTGFDSPPRLDAFLDAMRWGASSLADPRSVQAPFRSGIDIEDYQRDPVVRAVQMPRANLLIADDVGLGKTIDALCGIRRLLASATAEEGSGHTANSLCRRIAET